MTSEPAFVVRLDNFEGPFDLLLQLIAKHKLDVTEVALSRVTDEFIAHVRAMGPEWDLELMSNFLLVAATLLDLKAARLIPSGEVEDPEDLALLEARDLLFARLLQYRAFKEVSHWIAARLEQQSRRAPRPGGLEERFSGLLPEVEIRATPDDLARLAARALAPKEAVEVSLSHLHASTVSVVEEARLVVRRLRQQRRLTFADLVADAPDKLTTVCRFLALLELYRERAVGFEQPDPLGPLQIAWVGSDSGDLAISDEFDEEAAPADSDSGTPDARKVSR
ncbi:segregation and condensation protein A [Naumannella cuiyingiana]|uniref:Segregation and condensation protein A n=1 Tax=Naumannella cuiyingiana TaxID=1347891 RepID=A0A7Z0DBE1_9ACTN|nr:segregation and condensation protein A [Naumannella cuiyingiana]